MSDIFISYASPDREKTKALAAALQKKGWSVWWDRKIPPGKTFSQVIKEALDISKCIVVLWSKPSVGSDWVQNEAAEGAQRKILVPALIEDVEIPFEFRRIQAANLVNWVPTSPHEEFEEFVSSIGTIIGFPKSEKVAKKIEPQQIKSQIHQERNEISTEAKTLGEKPEFPKGNLTIPSTVKTSVSKPSSQDNFRQNDFLDKIKLYRVISMPVSKCSINPEGSIIASGNRQAGEIKIWDIATGKERETIKAHSENISSIAFSRDGRLLASGSSDHLIKIWDTETWQEIRVLKGHYSRVNSLAFSYDGLLLVSGGEEKTVKVWDVKTGQEKETLWGHTQRVMSVSVSFDGKFLASTTFGGKVKLWDMLTLEEIVEFDGKVHAVAFSPNALLLAGGGYSLSENPGIVCVWDASSRELLNTFVPAKGKEHSGSIGSIAFNVDGQLLPVAVLIGLTPQVKLKSGKLQQENY